MRFRPAIGVLRSVPARSRQSCTEIPQLLFRNKERGWGASGMGWIVAAFGIGAGAAAKLLAVRGRLPGQG